MITREYLERLAADFAAQIREYENNAAAARGALQTIQHLIEKYEEAADVRPAASPIEDQTEVKDNPDGNPQK